MEIGRYEASLFFFHSFGHFTDRGNRSSQRPPLNLPSLSPSNLQSNSSTSLNLIAAEKAHGTNVGSSFKRGKQPARILTNVAEGAGNAGPISVVNSFNRTKTDTSDSHNDSSIWWQGEYVSPVGDDPRDNPNGDEDKLPPSGVPGLSSSPHSE